VKGVAAELKEIIKESVISNTDVRIEITDEQVTVPGQSKPVIEYKAGQGRQV
jgi:hypothetical protein